MKNQILVLILFNFLVSCSSNQCIKEYIVSETSNDKKENIVSILNGEKSGMNYVLEVYNELNLKTGEHAKTFNQIDFDILTKLIKKEPKTEYWTEKDKKSFNFQEIIIDGIKNRTEIRDLEKQYNNLILYSLSKPIYLENSKATIFLVSKTKGIGKNIEMAVVVMKKENGKWKFIEKVVSHAEY